MSTKSLYDLKTYQREDLSTTFDINPPPVPQKPATNEIMMKMMSGNDLKSTFQQVLASDAVVDTNPAEVNAQVAAVSAAAQTADAARLSKPSFFDGIDPTIRLQVDSMLKQVLEQQMSQAADAPVKTDDQTDPEKARLMKEIDELKRREMQRSAKDSEMYAKDIETSEGITVGKIAKKLSEQGLDASQYLDYFKQLIALTARNPNSEIAKGLREYLHANASVHQEYDNERKQRASDAEAAFQRELAKDNEIKRLKAELIEHQKKEVRVFPPTQTMTKPAVQVEAVTASNSQDSLDQIPEAAWYHINFRNARHANEGKSKREIIQLGMSDYNVAQEIDSYGYDAYKNKRTKF